jgi:hypothetical protein
MLAKIHQDLCDWSTGDMAPARRQLVKQQAAAAGLGLSFRFPLPVHCWWAFSRPYGSSRRAADAAVAAVAGTEAAQQLGQQGGKEKAAAGRAALQGGG